MDTCGAPNPIMRMPFVANAGDATTIPIAAASHVTLLMIPLRIVQWVATAARLCAVHATWA
jgi:hypothetical protein